MSYRLFGLLLALLSPVIAQDKKPSRKSDAGLQVRLLAEVTPPGLGKVFLSFGEDKSEGFVLPSNQLSDGIPVLERGMVLKTVEKNIPLCSITLPEAGKSFAVILVTAKPSGFKPIIVRTDDPTFKAGDVFFINRSEKTVLGKLGQTPLILKPGTSAKSRPTGAVEDTYYDIAFATREEKGDKLLSSSRWPIDNNLRSYLFFFTNAQGRTSFRAVDEYLPAPASAN